MIERAAAARGMSARAAAKEASLSDARWRQIVNGYASVGAGQTVPVEGPAETIARMAMAVGVTPDQLRQAGRTDAADLLLVLGGMQAESEWQAVGTALDRLLRIRSELDAVIAELRSAPAPVDRPASPRPPLEVANADE